MCAEEAAQAIDATYYTTCTTEYQNYQEIDRNQEHNTAHNVGTLTIATCIQPYISYNTRY
jgi:hypothetical protein